MSKVEEFKNTFKCNLCNELLVRPIILPCGETICGKDLKIFFNNSDKFQCSICDEEHEQPKKGFPSNKNVQKQLDLQVNQIDFGKNCSKYEECKNKLIEVGNQMKEIDLIEKNPENFVSSYFEKIMNQVDIQREKLIEEINLYSEKTIESIKKIRDDLKANEKEFIVSNKFENVKVDLTQMNQDLNSFDINDRKIEQIMTNIEKVKLEMVQRLTQIQNKLLLNQSYEFKPVQINTLNMQDLVGSFHFQPLVYLI